jgi:hypothetical protein
MQNESARGKEPLPHDQTHRSHPTDHIRTDGGQNTVDTLAVIDRETGGHIAYEGPFRQERTEEYVEIALPIGIATEPGQITDETAAILTDFVGKIAITADGRGIETTGIIEAVETVGRTVGIRINDSLQRSPEPLALDFEDADVAVEDMEAIADE